MSIFSLARFGVVGLGLTCSTAVSVAQNTALRLLVFAADSRQPLAQAVASVAGRHFHASPQGEIRIPTDALTTDSLSVAALGYTSQRIAAAELRYHQPLHLSLTLTQNHLGEAIVMGRRTQHTQNSVSTTLSAADIQQQLGSNFATTLQQVKGMSLVQTGATIAKPVLHGMYGSRLLIMNNGVRQVGQQWGNDHAPELDANAAGSLNVVKGAEAVRYGAEALGGVIIMDAAPLPYGRTQWAGRAATLYGSNGRRVALTAQTDRGAQIWGGRAAWRLQATYLNGGDRNTARYLLNNSGARESNISLAAGFLRDRWGVEAFYSLFRTELGVLYSAQMGDETLLKERIAIGQPMVVSAWTRKIDVPRQTVLHHVARIKAFYQLAPQHRLSAQGAWQSDHREEFQLRRNFRSHIPELDLKLYNLQTDIAYQGRFSTQWSTEAGLFAAYTNNRNVPGTGVVPIIPNYTQRNVGAFAVEKFSGETWGAEAGARFDQQRLDALGLNILGERYGGKTRFNNFTYTLGAHWHLSDRLDLVVNWGTAWRAANVHELYSYGVEQSAGLFSQGDENLEPEVSRKGVVALKYAAPKLRASIESYAQWIDNYIYHEPTRSTKTVISGTYPLFRYRAADAFFRGADAEAEWDFLPQWSAEARASMIWASERRTGRFLPFVPSFRTEQSISWKAGSWHHIHDIYVKGSHRFVARQDRFDAATDLVDFAPPAYHLFGAEIGARWALRNGQNLRFLLSAENLLNRQYKEYTNRFRYFAHDLGRDLRIMVSWEF